MKLRWHTRQGRERITDKFDIYKKIINSKVTQMTAERPEGRHTSRETAIWQNMEIINENRKDEKNEFIPSKWHEKTLKITKTQMHFTWAT